MLCYSFLELGSNGQFSTKIQFSKLALRELEKSKLTMLVEEILKLSKTYVQQNALDP